MSLIEKAVIQQRLAEKTSKVGQRDHAHSLLETTSTLDLSNVVQVQIDPKHAFENRIVATRKDDSGASAYKMLRTRAAKRARTNGWKTIAVTAMRAGEGKSVTSINLALSLAAQPDQKVFLVDLDFHNHSVVKYTGLSGHAHLMDFVRGDRGLAEALVQVEDNGLYCLLNDEDIGDSSELLMSPAMVDLAKVFGSMDGIVIYDLPPLLEADDFLAFSDRVDCALVVVSEGQTTRRDLLTAADRLDGSNLLGVVLNRSRGDVPKYY
jgi:Mrp family chromosome partitioning ATPase